MSNHTVESVIEVIKKSLHDRNVLSDSDLQKITADSTTESLGFDSLDSLELIMDLEDHYGIELADDVVSAFKTIGDLARFIITVV
jgi:acyl carrier protein